MTGLTISYLPQVLSKPDHRFLFAAHRPSAPLKTALKRLTTSEANQLNEALVTSTFTVIGNCLPVEASFSETSVASVGQTHKCSVKT